MINYYHGDIFEAPIDILVHQANIFNTFGSGIAAAIKTRYPEAYQADCKTESGNREKLGKFSFAKVKNPKGSIKYIFNMYSQAGMSSTDRMTDYNSMVECLELIHEKISKAIEEDAVPKDIVIGVPFKIGCGLGGGNWLIVEAILKSIFEESPIQLLICKRDGD